MNKVHLIDCMEHMADLPDNHYDLAIVGPPYGINYNNKDLNRKSGSEFKNIKGDEIKGTNHKTLIDNLSRISKIIIVWGALNFIKAIPYKGIWICWDKRTKIEADNVLGSAFELAWCNKKNGYDKICRIMHGGVINADGANTKRIHPTQKPIALYKWLLQNYAKPGQTIFDSHVGSGSIRIACHDLGFDFEGCEIDEDYYNAQEARYQNHIKQSELFGTDEIQDLVYTEGKY